MGYQKRRSEKAGGAFADFGPGHEGLREIVAEGVAQVGAHAIGLVEFGGGLAEGVRAPADALEIGDQFFASRVDVQASFAGRILQAAVHDIDAIANAGVHGGGLDMRDSLAAELGEKITDEIPIGGCAGGAALMPTGVAVDIYGEGAGGMAVGLDALPETLAGHRGVSVFEDDFVENMYNVAISLREDRTHGVDVEIERPDETHIRVIRAGEDVLLARKAVIRAAERDGFETGFEFLTIEPGVELGGGAGQFLERDVAAIEGGEVKRCPFAVGLGGFEAIVQVVMALGRADEEGATTAIGESGTKNFGPDLGFHGGKLVEDHEVEAVAAKSVDVVGAAKRDGACAMEMNTEIGFADGMRGIVSS